MLQVCNKQPQLKTSAERKVPDIIVSKTETVIEYKDDCEVRRKKIKKTNITQLVNETKKLIKQMTAEEKVAELEKIFSK